jgi:DNA end-binding protein Ku
MQARGVVHMDDEQATRLWRRLGDQPTGLGGLIEGALRAICAERVTFRAGLPTGGHQRVSYFDMAAHSIGSATVSFGLVSVPVQLFAAGESKAAISFNWLHKKDGSRLKQQYVCSKDGEKVERGDMIKGYEFQKGQYVTFTPDELKALEERATGAIDIIEFLPAERVDRIWLDRTYYLGPDKGGERAYKLLAEALEKTKRVAIGQYAARGKQYLIMVRPMHGGLVMEQLRYADEIRDIAEVPIPKTEVKKPELDLAVKLIEQAATEDFQPKKYKDNVRDRMQEQIERKVEGKQITEEPEEAPKTRVLDLMQALKQSLEGADEKAEEKPAKRRKVAGKR